MALGAAAAYTAYILTGDRVGVGVPPLGARGARDGGGDRRVPRRRSLLTGGPDLGFAAGGWLWLGAIAPSSTVGAIIALRRVWRASGPSSAAILSTLEPVVTVALAAAAFGEALTVVQLCGGLLVLVRGDRVERPSPRGALPFSRRLSPASSTASVRGVGSDAGRLEHGCHAQVDPDAV